MGVADCALYPLFEAELVALMRRLIPPDQQNHIGESIVVKAALAR